jgi:hypothetical protein
VPIAGPDPRRHRGSDIPLPCACPASPRRSGRDSGHGCDPPGRRAGVADDEPVPAVFDHDGPAEAEAPDAELDVGDDDGGNGH